jgi:hypothetical protein
MKYEELDGRTISARAIAEIKPHSQRSVRMGDQNLSSRALCFGRHVKPVIPAVFVVVVDTARYGLVGLNVFWACVVG